MDATLSAIVRLEDDILSIGGQKHLGSMLENLCKRIEDVGRRHDDLSALNPRQQRQLWSLRVTLWKAAETRQARDASLTALLRCLWDLHVLCQKVGLFANPLDLVSAQYNVVKKLIETESVAEAMSRAESLYADVAKWDLPSDTDDTCQYRGPANNPNKSVKVALTVCMAVLTCGSYEMTKDCGMEKLDICVQAIESFEFWLSRTAAGMTTEFRSHLTSLLYYTERILMCASTHSRSAKFKGSLSKWISLVCCFVRLCVHARHSSSAGVSAFLVGVPLECLGGLCWQCFRCLAIRVETQTEGMKMINVMLRRCLKSEAAYREAKQLLKRFLSLEMNETAHLAAANVVQLMICFAVCTTSGNPVCFIGDNTAAMINRSIIQYEQNNGISEKDTMVVLEALGQLSYVLKFEAQSLMQWSDSGEIGQWIARVLARFVPILLSSQQLDVFRSIPSEKRSQLLSQAGMAVFKEMMIRPSETFDDHTHMWSLMKVLLDEANVKDIMTYRDLPRDIRVVFDTGMSCAALIRSEGKCERALECYRILCDLCSFIQKHVAARNDIPVSCLSTKLTGITYQACKEIMGVGKHEKEGLAFLENSVAHLLDAFEEHPVNDIQKIVQLYCKCATKAARECHPVAICSLTARVTRKAPGLLQTPERIARLFRSEMFGWLKALSRSDVHASHAPNPEQLSFAERVLESVPNKALGIWMKTISVAFSFYVQGMDIAQTIRSLEDLRRVSEPGCTHQMYAKEIMALCRSLLFLIKAAIVPSDLAGTKDYLMRSVPDRHLYSCRQRNEWRSHTYIVDRHL